MYETAIHHAANVEEAVDLANRFRDGGRYNWFRGQAREWPPHSSLFRARNDPERVALARRRLGMFFNWLENTSQLKPLLASTDSPFVIAQHYGIPTNYIDFTTEPGVAGFFAADTKAPQNPDEPACIYCVDTKELMSVWKIMKEYRVGAHMELIQADVSNLWRLESQHGCFLFCDYNWDVDFPMDRILFPQSGYPSWPTRETIYPPQKSALEILLDQYFDMEQRTFGSELLKKHLEKLKSEGQNVGELDYEFGLGYSEDAFRVANVLPHASWDPATLEIWNEFVPERMEHTIGAPVVLEIKPGQTNPEVSKSVVYGVRQFLNTNKRARQFASAWQLRGITLPAPLALESLSAYLQSVWNGMRSLPYSDAEIAAALGVTTHLFLEGMSYNDDVATANKVLGSSFKVEFGTKNGSSSRGYMKLESLRTALRDDLDAFISDHLKNVMQKDLRQVLLGVYSPDLLLDFKQLVKIFAHEMIPTQVLTRGLVLYSPAQLRSFGLP